MQMSDEPHTEFEVAIEREVHGALDEAEAIKLAEHLIGCALCRAYQRNTLEMESNMKSMGNLFSKGVEWGRLRDAVDERVNDEQVRFRLTVLMAVVGSVVVFIVLPLVRHRPPRFEMLAVMAVAIGLGLSVAWQRLRSFEQRAKDVAQSSDELFRSFHRINRSQTRQSLLALVTTLVGGAVIVPDAFHQDQQRGWVLLALFVAAVFSAAQRLVHLRRKRAAFSDN
jgi:hypothetical protein